MRCGFEDETVQKCYSVGEIADMMLSDDRVATVLRDALPPALLERPPPHVPLLTAYGLDETPGGGGGGETPGGVPAENGPGGGGAPAENQPGDGALGGGAHDQELSLSNVEANRAPPGEDPTRVARRRNGSRRRRGRDAEIPSRERDESRRREIPWRWVAAAPRPRRG